MGGKKILKWITYLIKFIILIFFLREEDADAKKRRKRTLAKRYALIGLATIGGGALIGVTGGLAAPFIGAGIGSVIGGSAAMALGSSTGIAVVGSLFGAAGAGLSGLCCFCFNSFGLKKN